MPSSSNETPSVNFLPIHRMANARSICPWATSRTSLLGASPFGFPIALSWKRVRISVISLSSRSVTSAGDLSYSHPLDRAIHLTTSLHSIRLHSLSTGAPISPDIPHLLAVLFPLFFDLCTGQPFIISIVPFAYVFCDLHFRFCSYIAGNTSVMPGKFVAAADVKEFEGAASSGAGGNVAKGASR